MYVSNYPRVELCSNEMELLGCNAVWQVVDRRLCMSRSKVCLLEEEVRDKSDDRPMKEEESERIMSVVVGIA